MAKYEPGDIVKYYFVVYETKDEKRIVGWTDNKELARIYMDFHKCKDFVLKSTEKTIEEITKITEENWNDEIRIHNIVIKNPDRHKGDDAALTISIPATRTESDFINEESVSFLLSQVQYAYLNMAIPYLKDKYKKALDDIFLLSIINKNCNKRNSPETDALQLDQLSVLLKLFPQMFGR